MPQPNWTNVKLEVVEEIVREAEDYLRAQLQCGIASDQRAVTLVGFLAAAATGILAVGAAWLTANPWSWPIIAAMASIAATATISIVYALKAASPVEFYYSGNKPEEWWDQSSTLTQDIKLSLGAQAENYQKSIDDNNSVLKRNAGFLNRALVFAAATPAVALLFAAAVWSMK